MGGVGDTSPKPVESGDRRARLHADSECVLVDTRIRLRIVTYWAMSKSRLREAECGRKRCRSRGDRVHGQPGATRAQTQQRCKHE
jgi:hypothetical protein